MTDTAPDAQTQAIVTATSAFLDSLSADQRVQVQFTFAPQQTATAAHFTGGPNNRTAFVGEQYGQAVWSNFPVSDVPRPGLTLGSPSAEQRIAAMHLLQLLLSPKGYQKVVEIMNSDQVLSESGTPYATGTAHYTLGIFGNPSASEPWMIQFGGHHPELNVTLVGRQGTLAPSLTGAQPAIYELEGKTVRPLGRETDKAFALLSSLDQSQRKHAILSFQIHDLVLGPGRDGQMIEPEGMRGSQLTAKQREMLLDLASEWTGTVHEAFANAKLEEMKKDIAETWFAWSGLTEEGRSAYFRIQGPTVIIEYAPQCVGGDPLNHIHTIYRDPTNNYGAKWLKQP